MKNLLLILFLFITYTAYSQEGNTITTNATCKAGQERIEKELKKLDGVFEVQFDSKGTITLDYSSDGTPYSEIVDKILECGFTANGKAPAGGDKNLCANKSPSK